MSQCSGPTTFSEKILTKLPHILIFTGDVVRHQPGKNLSEIPRIIELESTTLHLRACAFGDGMHFTGCILTDKELVFYDGMAPGEKK